MVGDASVSTMNPGFEAVFLVTNPFVELIKHPVDVLTTAGSFLFLVGVTILFAYVTLYLVLETYADYQQSGWTFPPLVWVVKLTGIPITVGIEVLAIAALLHLFI